MTKKEEFLKQCLVLDTETNSDDYKIAEIIEAGYAVLQNNEWVLTQELFKPIDRPIPPKVQSICYITNSMVEDKPAFVDNCDEFSKVVDSYRDGYMVAHNHFYDMRVLERHGIDTTDCNWICTWRLSKKLFGSIDSIEETNLPYLRFALELDVPIDMLCHRAGNDSFMTAKLLEFLVDMMIGTGAIDETQDLGPQIVQFCTDPIVYERMPFGKHKGTLMTDIPHSYWQWAMKNTHWFDEEADNFDPDLMASIHLALEKK